MVDAVQWQIVIPMFCEQVWGWFIEAALTAGPDPARRNPGRMVAAAVRSREPLQDAQADLLEIRAGFATLPQQIAKRG